MIKALAATAELRHTVTIQNFSYSVGIKALAATAELRLIFCCLAHKTEPTGLKPWLLRRN